MLVDSHCHLEMPEFDSDREETIERAHAAGVGFMLTIGDGSNPEAFVKSIELARERPSIATTIGLHPHQANRWSTALRASLLEAAKSDRVVAWGEIGLDYHYDFSPREDQRAAFEAQIRLALDCGLPIVIHCRKAEDDVFRIVKEHCTSGKLNGIMHCFTGDMPFAEKVVDLGFLISFSGIVTFPRAESIREAAAKLPEEVILVETDAPYLAPVPHRGKRNEPAFVVRTAEAVAKLRGIDLARIIDATSGNFFRLFPGLVENVR